MDPPEPSDLARQLKALEPRAAQTLITRLVDGLSRERCAALYGISAEAFDVKLWRALRAFAGASLPLEAFAQEQLEARALSDALEKGAPPADREAAAAYETAHALLARAPGIRAALDAAARAEETSPARRKEDLFRRIAIVLILALTAYFFLRSRT